LPSARRWHSSSPCRLLRRRPLRLRPALPRRRSRQHRPHRRLRRRRRHRHHPRRFQRIANESSEGKAATSKIQALQQKRATELNEKNKQLQAIQARIEKEGSVMSATAQADLAKQAERLNTDIQRFTQDAQQEITELQEQLRQQFEARVQPVLEEVRREKGLHFIFNGPDSGLVAADPGLDISADVIKRLDAKPAPTAKQ
jgi:outer membrane protein